MRPSPRLLALVLVLAALTVAAVVLAPEGDGLVAALWGLAVVLALLDVGLTLPSRRIMLQATLPETGFTGANVPLGLGLSAPRLPARMDIALHHSPGLSPPDMTTPLDTRGQGAISLTVPLTVLGRGDHQVSAVSIRYGSRLGLFEIIAKRPVNLAFRGVPDIGPVLSGAIQTQMLPLLDGARAMKLKGEGSEFHQLRDFVAGMDPRSIDWKRSARMREMVARETRAERNHQIMLCLDTGHLMAERLGPLSKLDHAINASLALAWAGGLAGDNVGFFSFAARPQPFLPPRGGKAAFGQIQLACTDLEQSAVETNHTLGLTTLGGRLKRRSLVVVFSDFVDTVTAELLVENLAVIQRQHLILYVALRDPALQAIARPAASDLDSVAQALAANRLLQDRQAVFDRLRRLGILCLDVAPGELTPALISRYIEIKAKEMV